MKRLVLLIMRSMNNDVVIERIDGLKNLFEEKFKDADKHFEEMKKKQDYTNGDVRKLKIWQARIVGGGVVLWAIVTAFLVPLINNYLSTSNKVEAQVDKAMSKYLEIEN